MLRKRQEESIGNLENSCCNTPLLSLLEKLCISSAYKVKMLCSNNAIHFRGFLGPKYAPTSHYTDSILIFLGQYHSLGSYSF